MISPNDTSLSTQIDTFLQKPETDRTSEERKEILESLGVKHPAKFLHSVWSTQWEVGIDRLLNPKSLYFRPLERSDFHFKWARGSFNALPQAVKAKVFLMKVQPNGVFEALKALFANVGIRVDSLEIKNVELVDKIHSEAAVTVLINEALERTFEISHFNLAGEEIFSRIAERSHIKKEPAHIYTTPQNVKVAFETRLGQDNLLSERWNSRFFLAYRDAILREVAEQDAIGDSLGTIGRDVHYNLTETGQVYSFHHRELFHPVSDMTPGFFEPIYIFLSRKIGHSESEDSMNQTCLEELYQVYRISYLDKNQQLRGLWTELQKDLFEMGALIQEYFREDVDVKKVIGEVESRLFLNTADWLDRIYAIFAEE
jgi:hypothetical protein